MISLNQYINNQIVNESFLGFVKKIKDKIFNKYKESTVEVNHKKIEMEKIADEVENKVIKNSHKQVDELLKDIAEIVKKDMSNFNKIMPVLFKWVETNNNKRFYNFDTLIGNSECTQYISKVCGILVNKYGWDDLEYVSEPGEDEEGRWDEGGEIFYNTAYIAFMLSSIAEDL